MTEGQYRLEVSAPSHSSSTQTIEIRGLGNNQTVFIPKQVVTYTFTVVPVALTDTYTFTAVATFEAQVPLPGIDQKK